MELVADIGGTNARLALAEAGRPLDHSIRSFRNDAFDGFDAVLDTYLQGAGRPAVAAVCVAIAGPVHGDHGSLTNRNWRFHTTHLADAAGANRCVLMNDLAALGYALPHLAPGQSGAVRPGRDGARRNGQSFVLGLGTGVNLAVSMAVGRRSWRVLEAEAGHVGLPWEVRQHLQGAIGVTRAEAFFSVEELFAGRGLSALHRCLSGGDDLPGAEIIARAGQDTGATVNLFARLLGMTLRELILLYLPLDGIFLAGGVSRGVLSAARDPFLDALAAPHMLDDILAAPEIRLIEDDAAALRGCAARLEQEEPA